MAATKIAQSSSIDEPPRAAVAVSSNISKNNNNKTTNASSSWFVESYTPSSQIDWESKGLAATNLQHTEERGILASLFSRTSSTSNSSNRSHQLLSGFWRYADAEVEREFERFYFRDQTSLPIGIAYFLGNMFTAVSVSALGQEVLDIVWFYILPMAPVCLLCVIVDQLFYLNKTLKKHPWRTNIRQIVSVILAYNIVHSGGWYDVYINAMCPASKFGEGVEFTKARHCTEVFIPFSVIQFGALPLFVKLKLHHQWFFSGCAYLFMVVATIVEGSNYYTYGARHAVIIITFYTTLLVGFVLLGTLRYRSVRRQFEDFISAEIARRQMLDRQAVVSMLLESLVPLSVLPRLMDAELSSSHPGGGGTGSEILSAALATEGASLITTSAIIAASGPHPTGSTGAPGEFTSSLASSSVEEVDFEPDASVLFSDIADFTRWSATRTAAQVVAMLNLLVTEFDEAAKAAQVERVKTIGDSYWAVCGMPHFVDDHAYRLISFGQQMLRIVAKFNARHPEWRTELGAGVGEAEGEGDWNTRRRHLSLSGISNNSSSPSHNSRHCKGVPRPQSLSNIHRNGVQMRIGIHSGKLSGAILGMKQIAYEVFGETNDIAALAEQYGVPGYVAVTERTLEACSFYKPEIIPYWLLRQQLKHEKQYHQDEIASFSSSSTAPTNSSTASRSEVHDREYRIVPLPTSSCTTVVAGGAASESDDDSDSEAFAHEPPRNSTAAPRVKDSGRIATDEGIKLFFLAREHLQTTSAKEDGGNVDDYRRKAAKMGKYPVAYDSSLTEDDSKSSSRTTFGMGEGRSRLMKTNILRHPEQSTSSGAATAAQNPFLVSEPSHSAEIVVIASELVEDAPSSQLVQTLSTPRRAGGDGGGGGGTTTTTIVSAPTTHYEQEESEESSKEVVQQSSGGGEGLTPTRRSQQKSGPCHPPLKKKNSGGGKVDDDDDDDENQEDNGDLDSAVAATVMMTPSKLLSTREALRMQANQRETSKEEVRKEQFMKALRQRRVQAEYRQQQLVLPQSRPTIDPEVSTSRPSPARSPDFPESLTATTVATRKSDWMLEEERLSRRRYSCCCTGLESAVAEARFERYISRQTSSLRFAARLVALCYTIVHMILLFVDGRNVELPTVGLWSAAILIAIPSVILTYPPRLRRYYYSSPHPTSNSLALMDLLCTTISHFLLLIGIATAAIPTTANSINIMVNNSVALFIISCVTVLSCTMAIPWGAGPLMAFFAVALLIPELLVSFIAEPTSFREGAMTALFSFLTACLYLYISERVYRQTFMEQQRTEFFIRETQEHTQASEDVLQKLVPPHVIPSLTKWISSGMAAEDAIAQEYEQLCVAFIKFSQRGGVVIVGATTTTTRTTGLANGGDVAQLRGASLSTPRENLELGGAEVKDTHNFQISGHKVETVVVQEDGEDDDTTKIPGDEDEVLESTTAALVQEMDELEQENYKVRAHQATMKKQEKLRSVQQQKWLLQAHRDLDDLLESFPCLTKIKTIGDVLMVAGPFGCGTTTSGSTEIKKDRSSSQDIIDLQRTAFQLLDLISAINSELPHLQANAGLHVGPVMAAVLGVVRPMFDVFGDTVNTASRVMTSSRLFQCEHFDHSQQQLQQLKEQGSKAAGGVSHGSSACSQEFFDILLQHQKRSSEAAKIALTPYEEYLMRKSNKGGGDPAKMVRELVPVVPPPPSEEILPTHESNNHHHYSGQQLGPSGSQYLRNDLLFSSERSAEAKGKGKINIRQICSESSSTCGCFGKASLALRLNRMSQGQQQN